MNTTSPLRVALVTGGSRGIGAAISERLAADGYAVVVNYAGRQDEAAQVVARIRASGGEAHALQADVSDNTAVEQLFDAIESRYGGIDVLVNNAGVMHLSAIAQFDDAEFDRLVN